MKFLLILVPNSDIIDITYKRGIIMVERNVIIAKAGGTAGKNSVNYKISLPAEMVKEMGITQEDGAVIVSFIDGKIIIEKKENT